MLWVSNNGRIYFLLINRFEMAIKNFSHYESFTSDELKRKLFILSRNFRESLEMENDLRGLDTFSQLLKQERITTSLYAQCLIVRQILIKRGAI